MGQIAQGPWTKAFYSYVDKPKYTNRDASGLIKFARGIVNTFGRSPDVSLTPWDWYVYALPSLGWFKSGDKFKVDTKWQLQPYKASRQLRDALLTMATELDEARVPFKPTDPRGSDTTFRALAVDAWDAMKNLRAQGLYEGGNPPPELERVWETTTPEITATLPSSPIATSASSAAKKPSKPKKEPEPREQLPLPGVPGEARIQPVEPPKKGGGGAWLLLLLLLGKKKKRGGRR